MAETTKIAWCDHTASPWHGCSKTSSPGCDNCYAAAMAVRNPGTLGVWGDDGTRVKSKSFVANLRRWQKKAAAEGKTVTVFPSICDPFEDRPELVPWRQEMFAVADECPNVVLLLLTKRPENVRRMWPDTTRPPQKLVDEVEEGRDGSRYALHRPNVHLGESISDQPTLERNVPKLLECRDLCPVLFVSAEPLLGPVRLDHLDVEATSQWCQIDALAGRHTDMGRPCPDVPAIDWVIVGGESGPHARPCNIEWIRSIRDQCQAAGVPVFIKQLGSKTHCTIGQHHRHPEWVSWMNLKDAKGGDMNEFPADLRVRQFPATEAAIR